MISYSNGNGNKRLFEGEEIFTLKACLLGSQDECEKTKKKVQREREREIKNKCIFKKPFPHTKDFRSRKGNHTTSFYMVYAYTHTHG